MKLERHSKIVELIGKKEIETQEELVEELRKAGFRVTQATVSRDIREMRLTKVATDSGKQRYTVMQNEDPKIEKYVRILRDSYQGMDRAQNLLVVKTVSCFISLEKVLPAVRALLSAEGEVVALIKPQFEAGREQVGKHGVVREPKIHVEVIEKVLGYAAASGFVPHGLSFSPIRGPEGNIEYLIWLRTAEESEGAPAVTPETARAVVRAAHETLTGGKA